MEITALSCRASRCSSPTRMWTTSEEIDAVLLRFTHRAKGESRVQNQGTKVFLCTGKYKVTLVAEFSPKDRVFAGTGRDITISGPLALKARTSLKLDGYSKSYLLLSL